MDGQFLRTNMGLVYLAAIVGVPAFILSVLVGLNPAFTIGIFVLFFIATVLVQKWRRRRGPTSERAWSVGLTGIMAAIAVFALIQAVPFGRVHANGALVSEPAWPDQETRALIVRGCYDCHSNEVKYPWYSNIAPISWLVADHVNEGRDALNFSEFAASSRAADDVIEQIQEREMPPSYFTRFGLHSTAKLSDAEITKLLASLRTMPEFRKR